MRLAVIGDRCPQPAEGRSAGDALVTLVELLDRPLRLLVAGGRARRCFSGVDQAPGSASSSSIARSADSATSICASSLRAFAPFLGAADPALAPPARRVSATSMRPFSARAPSTWAFSPRAPPTRPCSARAPSRRPAPHGSADTRASRRSSCAASRPRARPCAGRPRRGARDRGRRAAASPGRR